MTTKPMCGEDMGAEKRLFSNVAEEHKYALHFFEEGLMDIQCFDYDRLSCDDYDLSIEFYEVPDDVRLTEEAQKYINGHGFYKIWLNHKDGWETLYSYGLQKDGFKPSDGWRKRQWKRKLADGSKDPSGLIELEKDCAGWPREWFENGYCTIVNPTTPHGGVDE